MPRSNVVEYVFEGNTVDLQTAIKIVQQLLRRSVADLNKYQEGGLNATQQSQVAILRSLIKNLQKYNRKGSKLTAQQSALATKIGKDALSQVTRFRNASLKAQDKYNAAAAKQQAKSDQETIAEAEKVQSLISTSSQANALEHAKYLDTLAEKMHSAIGNETYNDIKNVVAAFETAQQQFKEGKISAEQLAAATDVLQKSFVQYNDTLRTASRNYQAANHSVKSFNDLIKQGEAYMEMTISSISFWIQAIKKLIAVIKEGIQYYASYVESLNFLERASGSASKQMLAFAEAQADAFGLDPEQVNTVTAMFYSFADSMGFASDQCVLISQNFAKLAQDIASLQNIDLETAATKLRSALAGQSRALAELGINVTDANVDEWLLSKGIHKSMSSMNEASQSAARYAFILDKTGSAQGDLAKTLQSPANQLKILAAQIKIFIRNIGGIASTFFMPIVKMLNIALQSLNAFGTGLLSISAKGYTFSIGSATDATEDLTDAATDASKATIGLTDLDEINQASASSSSTSGGIDSDIALLLKSYDNGSKSISSLVNVFKSLGEAMAPIWAMLNNSSGISLITSLFEGLGYALYPLKFVLDGIAYVFNLLPEPIRNVFATINELVFSVVALCTALALLKTLMATHAWQNFANIMTTLWQNIVAVVKAVWAKIAAVTTDITVTNSSTLASRTNADANILQRIANSDVAKSIVAKVSALTAEIVAINRSIIATVKMTAVSAAQRIANWWEAASWWAKAAAIIAAAGAAAAIVAGIVIASVAAVNSASSSSDSAHSSTPKMAKGGVVTAPTLAMIGEGQYNEAVVPLGNSPQFQSMQEGIAAAVMTSINSEKGTRGSTQPIILQMDGRELARALWPKLVDTQLQAGVKIK